MKFVRDDNSSEGNDVEPRFTDLPEAVQRLADAMIGIDANWCFEDWLQEKAEGDLEILNIDLQRARLQAEQRLFRIESLEQRLELPDEVNGDGRLQRNLFDCFDIVDRGLANNQKKNHLQQTDDDELEPHPASYLTALLPGEACDDPFLAITAQSILFEIHRIVGEGKDSAPLAMIAETLLARKISKEEIEEALDHLLMQGEIHEVEDNCFIAEE